MPAVLTSPFHGSPAALRRRIEQRDAFLAWIQRVLAAALVACAVLFARHFLLTDNAHARSRVTRVKLVTAQRPPPPKPQEVKAREEKPKEPDKPKEVENYQGQLALIEPANTAPPGPPGPAGPPGEKALDDQLGVEADGEGAGDGFGLVAKRGGHDITRLGGGGGGGGGISAAQQRAIFRSYGQTVAQRLEHELQASAAVLADQYVVVTQIWVDAHGRIVRSELARSSGSAQIDSALRRALSGAAVMPEPPSGLPQPLNLRFTVKDVSAADAGG